MEVESDNQDAIDDPQGLLCYLLLGVSAQIVKGYASGALFDRNGNRVGSWCLTTDGDQNEDD